jgi:uncharacterized delta-60 repeat protein
MNSMHRIAGALSLAFITQVAFPANGELDPAFGTAGRARIVLPQSVTLNSAALQPDGKVVVVGTKSSTSAPLDSDFFVARLSADGSLDTSFHGDGMSTVDFNHGDDQARAVSITADNHILIVGSSFSTHATALFNDSTAARLNSDGSLDASFGSGGKATYSFGGAANGFGTGSTALAALADGRYIVGGGSDNTQGNGDFQLIRINVNGSLDTTFGTGGRTLVDFGQVGDDLVGVVVQSDGRIVAAGSSQKNGVHAVSAVRLLATGQPDTSVGDGRVSIQLEDGGTASSIAATADGKLLIAGSIPARGSFDDLAVVMRLLPDGTLDPTFGSGGRVVRPTEINAVAADTSGHVYFAGTVINDTPIFTSTWGLVQALDSDGSALDNFGSPIANLGAGVAIDSGHDDVVSDFTTFSLLRLGDGRLIVLGRNTHSELLAVRLLASGGSGGVISLFPSYQPTSNSGGHVTLSETKSGIDYLVLRAGGVTGPVSVHYEASSTSGAAGTDYVATSGTMSWADGDITPKTLKVPLIDDVNYEAAASPITLTLSAPTGGASIGTSKVDVYVSSDEGQAIVGSGFTEAYEGDSSIRLPVTRTGDPRLPITVSYTVVGAPPSIGNGSAAIDGTDFTPVSGTLTWSSYDVSRRYITVALLNDNVEDGTKGLAVNFSNPSPGVVTQGNFGGSAFLYDDETAYTGVSFEFLDRNVAVSESAGTVTLRVRRNDVLGHGTADAATYDVATDFAPGTARVGTDFGTPNPTQLTWAANDFSTKTITIPIVNDPISEGPEDFSVNLILTQGAYNYAATRVLIDDDDAPPAGGTQLSMRDATLSVAENVGSVPIVVERTGNMIFPVTVDLRVASQGTQQGTDFTASTTATLSWDAGDATPKTLNVPIIADSQSEPDETFTMTLENPTGGATIGSRTSTAVTIQGDLTGSGPGSMGFTTDTITVSEDAPYVDLPVARVAAGGGASLTYSVRSGATADIGREVVFVNQPEPVRFFDPMPPVNTVQNIRVYLNGDRRDEPEESFVVDLRRADGSLPGGTNAITVKLTSADATPPTQLGLAATSISQAENQTTVNLTVNRTGGGTGPVTVHYETVAGTATAGADFTAASGDLQWAAGDTGAKSIAVTLINDTAVESTENFTVKLSAPTGGATLGSDTATISITDDDTTSGGGGGGSGGGGGAGGSAGGGGGGAFDLMSLVALSLMLAFSRSTVRRGGRQATGARSLRVIH